MYKKNIFLTFCCACVPGCGQMYQGYMKRGVSLLFWFIAIIVGGVLLNLGVISVLAVVVWAYSFFDSFNIRNLSPEQRGSFYDDYVPSRRWMQENHLDSLTKSGRGSKLLAWVLIGIGAVTLYQNFLYGIVYSFLSRFPYLWEIYYAIPRLAIGVGVILVGIWMLRRTTTEPKATAADEDVVHYLGEGSHEEK